MTNKNQNISENIYWVKRSKVSIDKIISSWWTIKGIMDSELSITFLYDTLYILS